jgi:hypothetical protein
VVCVRRFEFFSLHPVWFQPVLALVMLMCKQAILRVLYL